MRCDPRETDIETIVNRIRAHDIDLQPDFQRSEVWTQKKKQKLIDSILRGWHIPPVHLVESDGGIFEVLDGQQRLTTIRDFIAGELTIDGRIQPDDPNVVRFHGMAFNELPDVEKRRIKRYGITMVQVTDCQPEESAELFYRLNQPQPLTSAEQRNAFMGIPRNQVKELSLAFVEAGASKETIGFSNSRLAYDEVISKFCYAIESKTLRKKITSNDISAQYRENRPFSDECIEMAHDALIRFIDGVKAAAIEKPAFNKATVYSWLVFAKKNPGISSEELSAIVGDFETCRFILKTSGKSKEMCLEGPYLGYRQTIRFFEPMLDMYTQRSSMASTDATSVVYRDIVLALFEELHLGKAIDESRLLTNASYYYDSTHSIADVFALIQEEYGWGERF